ncbi:MAG: T9SS type A sorting domain-containing protein, partial [Muribaculaceae bacterium]|nr:T9SS type A sorting domain-containing protein [Muribaculaceae bacterium]
MQGSRARVVGGDFAIEAAQATSVDIFNLAGQLVKSASLPQGTSVIDGQNLGRGVYLVRFASGTTVKVMK